jgi:hypothetical protein
VRDAKAVRDALDAAGAWAALDSNWPFVAEYKRLMSELESEGK